MPRRPPPPVIALAALGAAYAVHLAVPTPVFAPPPWNLAGLLGLAAGLALAAAAARRFRAQDTTVHPWRVPGAMVTEGPYRWTRNPMYLGLTLVALGLAGLVGTAAMLLAPALFVLVVDRWVIPWEERMLEATFGEGYGGYKARVRRWL